MFMAQYSMKALIWTVYMYVHMHNPIQSYV